MWGERFLFPETRKWSSTPSKGTVRGFGHLVLRSLRKIFALGLLPRDEATAEMERLCSALAVTYKPSEAAALLDISDGKTSNKRLIKSLMMRWMPAHQAMFEVGDEHVAGAANCDC